MHLEPAVYDSEPYSSSMDCHTREFNILVFFYSRLRDSLTDIDSLLPHCFEKSIITHEEMVRIKLPEKISQDKVENLLIHVFGPLKYGNSKAFYSLLQIMESYGTISTKDLAKDMRSKLMSEMAQ